MFYNFIWNNKRDGSKSSAVLCNTKSSAGDWCSYTFSNSLKTTWRIKLPLEGHHRTWKTIFNYALRNFWGGGGGGILVLLAITMAKVHDVMASKTFLVRFAMLGLNIISVFPEGILLISIGPYVLYKGCIRIN